MQTKNVRKGEDWAYLAFLVIVILFVCACAGAVIGVLLHYNVNIKIGVLDTVIIGLYCGGVFSVIIALIRRRRFVNGWS